MRSLSRRKRRVLTNPEITLTPLIDTALTLLIIFMVTTPIIQNAVKIDLPKGQAKEGNKEPQKLVVMIDKQNTIYCNNKIVTIDTLKPEVVQHLAQGSDKEETMVWIKPDCKSESGCLTGVIDCIKRIKGVSNVTIATEEPHNARVA